MEENEWASQLQSGDVFWRQWDSSDYSTPHWLCVGRKRSCPMLAEEKEEE